MHYNLHSSGGNPQITLTASLSAAVRRLEPTERGCGPAPYARLPRQGRHWLQKHDRSRFGFRASMGTGRSSGAPGLRTKSGKGDVETAADAMRISVLGPLEVTDAAGQPVRVGGHRVRALLILLALDASRVIPAPALIERLWPQDRQERPADAVNALQSLVSRLRVALRQAGLPEGVLESATSGYRLAVPPEAVDAITFGEQARAGREALARGDARAAASLLRNALNQWRGGALIDVAGETFAFAPAARLAELQAAATLDRLCAALNDRDVVLILDNCEHVVAPLAAPKEADLPAVAQGDAETALLFVRALGYYWIQRGYGEADALARDVLAMTPPPLTQQLAEARVICALLAAGWNWDIDRIREPLTEAFGALAGFGADYGSLHPLVVMAEPMLSQYDGGTEQAQQQFERYLTARDPWLRAIGRSPMPPTACHSAGWTAPRSSAAPAWPSCARSASSGASRWRSPSSRSSPSCAPTTPPRSPRSPRPWRSAGKSVSGAT
jgi:DNA-binding winged helix-turn-helix (wHTH) protein